MREIHSLENIDETIEERAESELGYGVEIGERLHAAKKATYSDRKQAHE